MPKTTAPYCTVVCARADHPEGYGHKERGTAHGYVLLVVQHVPTDSLSVVMHRLTRPVSDPWGEWWANWYGGRFEPVLVIDGPLNAEASLVMAPGVVRSIGDNRAVLLMEYDELTTDAKGSDHA